MKNARKVGKVDDWILSESKNNMYDFDFHTIIGLEGMQNNFTALFNNQPYHGPSIALNCVTNAILRTFSGGKGKILAHNHPLPNLPAATTTMAMNDIKDDPNKKSSASLTGFVIGLVIVFAMSFLTSGFVVFLIRERASSAKHLQFVSGANFFIFWMGNLLIDYLYYILPCLLMVLLFVGFRLETLETFEIFGLVFLLLLLHGWAVIPLMYLCSFLFSSPSSGYTRMAIINVVTGEFFGRDSVNFFRFFKTQIL